MYVLTTHTTKEERKEVEEQKTERITYLLTYLQTRDTTISGHQNKTPARPTAYAERGPHGHQTPC